MSIKIINKCPLGMECEKVVNDAIVRCNWYQKLVGTDPSTGDPIDEWKCALVWNNILLIENSAQQRSTAAAVESTRNEFVSNAVIQHQLLLSMNQPPIIREDPKLIN